MGSSLSTTASNFLHTFTSRQAEETEQHEEHEEEHPSKRRKINPPDRADDTRPELFKIQKSRQPLHQVTNQSNRGSPSKKNIVDPFVLLQDSQSKHTSKTEAKSQNPPSTPRKRPNNGLPFCRPDSFQEALRVEIVELALKDDLDDQKLQDFHKNYSGQGGNIKCRCSATLYYAKNDKSPDAPTTRNDYIDICRLNRTGILHTLAGLDGTLTSVLKLDESFIFLKEDFYVNRKDASPSGMAAANYVPYFADAYAVRISLEPYGYQENWPPTYIPPFQISNPHGKGLQPTSNVISKSLHSGHSSKHDIRLVAQAQIPLSQGDKYKDAKIQYMFKNQSQVSPYVLRLEVGWASLWAPPTPPKLITPIRARPKPSSSNLFPITASSFSNGNAELSSNGSGDTRSFRRRERKIYNLKELSDMVRQPGPSKASPEKAKSKSGTEVVGEGMNVTYSFQEQYAAETGIRRSETHKGLTCSLCHARHRSLESLRVHLTGEHHNFEFGLRRSTPRVLFFVKPVDNRNCPPFDPSRVFHLSKPITFFDLDKYLDGDESFIKSREGPEHGRWPQQLQKTRLQQNSVQDSTRSSPPSHSISPQLTEKSFPLNPIFQDSPRSPSPGWSSSSQVIEEDVPPNNIVEALTRPLSTSGSCLPIPIKNRPPQICVQDSTRSPSPSSPSPSSPNTTSSLDEQVSTKAEISIPSRPRKVFKVPHTSQPLFDTITKRILEPGEEISASDDETDETWFHQKHRDIIHDFSDILPEEKEYFSMWNPFIVDKKLSSLKYLPDVILEFVEAKKGWLAGRGKEVRKEQFLKHMETFILLGDISENCLHECIGIIRDEAQRKSLEDVDMDKGDKLDEGPATQRGLMDCICFKHIQGPNRVVCRGKQCKGRFFHRECAQQFGRPIVGVWYCDGCLP